MTADILENEIEAVLRRAGVSERARVERIERHYGDSEYDHTEFTIVPQAAGASPMTISVKDPPDGGDVSIDIGSTYEEFWTMSRDEVLAGLVPLMEAIIRGDYVEWKREYWDGGSADVIWLARDVDGTPINPEQPTGQMIAKLERKGYRRVRYNAY